MNLDIYYMQRGNKFGAYIILHCVITISFCKSLVNDSNKLHWLKTTSILSFVFVLVLNPILIRVESRSTLPITPSTQALEAHIILRQLISNGLIIRHFALSALLIAASMSFYYCIIRHHNMAHSCQVGPPQ